MSKSKRHKSRSRSRSAERRDKDKKRHRHRDDKDFDKKKRSKSDHDRDRDHHSNSSSGRKHCDDGDRDRGRDRGRDVDRDRDRDRDKKSSKHYRDSSSKDLGSKSPSRSSRDSNSSSAHRSQTGIQKADVGGQCVEAIAARISERALNAAKSQDNLEKTKRDKEEEIQQQRRDRLQAWRQAQTPSGAARGQSEEEKEARQDLPPVTPATALVGHRPAGMVAAVAQNSPSSTAAATATVGVHRNESESSLVALKTMAPSVAAPLSMSMSLVGAKKPQPTSKLVGAAAFSRPDAAAGSRGEEEEEEEDTSGRRSSDDNGNENGNGNDNNNDNDGDDDSDFDPLDAFMSSLYDTGDVTEQFEEDPKFRPNSGGGGGGNSSSSSLGAQTATGAAVIAAEAINPNGSNFITLEQITGAGRSRKSKKKIKTDEEGDTDTASVRSKVYDPADWQSDVSFSPGPGATSLSSSEQVVDEEQEERERRDFLEALRDMSSGPPAGGEGGVSTSSTEAGAEGHQQQQQQQQQVEVEVEEESSSKASQQQLGRIFAGEGDMIEESEVAAKKKSALDVLEEQRRGKELKPVDHAALQLQGCYPPFRKNLYIVPRVLARMSIAELQMKRDALQMKVRGKGCPAPVDTWDQCGLSERCLSVIKKLNFEAPFSIQKQALPAIMCGRDIIAVAKTGSGKTLAFLLPMFRHILDQPPLKDSEGPIGIIMAPARELAFQIYNEAKKFTKALGLTAACVYGGAGVADQIADLKRGADIVVCTPGRMIDILCMQAGKLVTLKRVTMIVMDEADRMFDMGFEPQIKMILQNVRPDHQTVLFSATFPKQIEKLAKSVLHFPLEIVVGERSTANKDITQVVEVHEPEEKYMRLLQLLGIWYERGSVLIFVDKQETCDQLFQDLLKSGYPCVSLHGGKDQLDRDHTLHEFKTGDKTVMVATSVAGRGLDVPEIVCVINYHCPNHMEDYVHRVGRTGRAGRKGTAYTFVAPSEEQHAPTMLAVLQKAGVTGKDVPEELVAMAAAFKEKVKRGEAQWSSNGFSGSKGFSFDSSEMNETQKLASLQRRAYEIEQGIVPDRVELEEGDGDGEFYDQGEEAASSSNSSSSSVPPPPPPPPPQPPVPVHDASGTALVVLGGEGQGAPAQLSALERARALAVSMGFNTGTGGSSTAVVPAPPGQPPSLSLTADGRVDTNAALQRAHMIAMQMTGGGVVGEDQATGAGGDQREQQQQEHFSEDLEINDYPANVRRKVTMRATLDEVTDRTGTNIISRGSYVAAGKKAEAGERKLFLLIEGPSEMQVKQARLEVVRLLEEETIRQGASGSFSGRYNVT